jgi:hypothetical protein
MKRSLIILTLFAALLLFSSCAPPDSDMAQSEINITGMVSSIGAASDTPADQRFSCTITLQNNGLTDVTIRYIEPVLLGPFIDKARGNDFKIMVNKTIAPEACIEVSGEILFDALGMTKEQIVAMEPFFNEIIINTDKVLPVHNLSH